MRGIRDTPVLRPLLDLKKGDVAPLSKIAKDTLKGVGYDGEKQGVFHHWARFNSHEAFFWSHGVTLR
jgi:hypothetical protein